MMNTQHGDIQCETKRGGDACAYQQRPCQARTLSVGDGIEVSQMEAGGAQSLPDEGQYAPYVVAGGELRHYPAVFAMHFALRIERVAQQATLAVVKRDASFVAGGFNTKNK